MRIPGVGPVPVAAVRRQLPDAFVKILVLDGEDVTTVCHVGRERSRPCPERPRRARPVCVVPGCDVAFGLENHHWDVDYAECKTTHPGRAGPGVSWHHGLITYEG